MSSKSHQSTKCHSAPKIHLHRSPQNACPCLCADCHSQPSDISYHNSLYPETHRSVTVSSLRTDNNNPPSAAPHGVASLLRHMRKEGCNNNRVGCLRKPVCQTVR